MVQSLTLFLRRILVLLGLPWLVGLCAHRFASGSPGPPPTSRQALQGTVLNRDGNPAEGALVYLTEQWFERDIADVTMTDDTGHFLFPNRAGGRNILIVVVQNGSMIFASTSGAQPLTIRLGPTTELQIPFVDAGGKPIVGREVAVFPTMDQAAVDGTVSDRAFPRLSEALKARLMERTDARGVLTLPGLPQGRRISLTIEADRRFPPLMLRGSIRLGNGSITRVPAIRIALNASISGRVTYRRSGKPVANAAVTLVGPGYHNFMATAQTDAAGGYRFERLFPASYMVMMQDSKALQADLNSGEKVYLPLARTKQGKWLPPFTYSGIALAAGERTAGIDFILIRSASIQVQATDENEHPLFGAFIWLKQPDGSGEGRSTDLDGTCRFQVPPGTITASLSLGSSLEAQALKEQHLTVNEGELRTDRFSLASGRTIALSAPRGHALAPDITVLDRNDKPVKLSDLRAKVVVLDFRFPEEQDSYMAAALRHTNAVVSKMASKSVVALAVDTQDQKDDFDRWIARHPELTALYFARDASDWHRTGQGIVSTRYRVTGWPQRFVIAPDGTLRRRFEGDEINDESLLKRTIDQALTQR